MQINSQVAKHRTFSRLYLTTSKVIIAHCFKLGDTFPLAVTYLRDLSIIPQNLVGNGLVCPLENLRTHLTRQDMSGTCAFHLPRYILKNYHVPTVI